MKSKVKGSSCVCTGQTGFGLKGQTAVVSVSIDSCFLQKQPQTMANMPLVYCCRFSAAVPVCMKQMKKK